MTGNKDLPACRLYHLRRTLAVDLTRVYQRLLEIQFLYNQTSYYPSVIRRDILKFKPSMPKNTNARAQTSCAKPVRRRDETQYSFDRVRPLLYCLIVAREKAKFIICIHYNTAGKVVKSDWPANIIIIKPFASLVRSLSTHTYLYISCRLRFGKRSTGHWMNTYMCV